MKPSIERRSRRWVLRELDRSAAARPAQARHRHINGRSAEFGLGRGSFQTASTTEVMSTHVSKAAVRALR
jgi:hypothetical protein